MTVDITKYWPEFGIVPRYFAEQLTKQQRDKWNIVSIHDGVAANLDGAKTVCENFFHDMETQDRPEHVLCEEKHIRNVLEFAENHLGEAFLIHCHAGISRSTAIGLLIILNQIYNKEKQINYPVDEALEIVYSINKNMWPNKHVLKLGFKLITQNDDLAALWMEDYKNSEIMQKITNNITI